MLEDSVRLNQSVELSDVKKLEEDLDKYRKLAASGIQDSPAVVDTKSPRTFDELPSEKQQK